MSVSQHSAFVAHIKKHCEDFVVEEIPAYEPAGEGEHLYLWVEKRDASAKFTLRQLKKSFGVAERDIGSAGNKDRRAITRQYFSVPARQVDQEAMGELPWALTPDIEVLRVALHHNKLRRGHLRGNRFEIVARMEGAWTREALEEVVKQRVVAIRKAGMKNLYGAQRFGHEDETVKLGFALLSRQQDALRRVKRDRFLKRLALNAAQSALFNATLSARLAAGGGQWEVLRGDVLELTGSGGRFVCEDPGEDQQRLDRGELVITGPMHGVKMRAPEHEALAFERSVLEEQGVSVESFSAFSKLCSGTRRSFQVAVADLEARVYSEQEVHLRFSLPSGSYATVLLSQIFDEVRF